MNADHKAVATFKTEPPLHNVTVTNLSGVVALLYHYLDPINHWQHNLATDDAITLKCWDGQGFKLNMASWPNIVFRETRTQGPITISADTTLMVIDVNKKLVVINASVGGTVYPLIGEHYYDPGTVVPITATAGPNATFDHWDLDDGSTSTDNPLNLTVDKDVQVNAVFTATGGSNILAVLATVGLIALMLS
jgi:hypothetical protein